MALKIEACPFCGGHHMQIIGVNLTYSVSCQSCHCRGPCSGTTKDAVKLWNTACGQLVNHQMAPARTPSPDTQYLNEQVVVTLATRSRR